MPKRQKQEDSQTNAASFRLRDVTICMAQTNQIDAVRFTIERKADANSARPDTVVAGRIMTEENGTTLSLVWSEDVTVSAMDIATAQSGHVRLAIGKHTSK